MFGALVIGLAVALGGQVLAALPTGWMASGSAPSDYEMAVDRAVQYEGKPTASVKSAKPSPAGFATMMQIFTPSKYRGKRVRFSAAVKAENVKRWAGLWMRVDGEGGKAVAFDNMQDRPLTGTTEWTRYNVVLDVAEEATAVAFGILLDGPGAVWMGDVKFEIVDSSVPVTGRGLKPLDAPTNGDFTQ